MVVPADKLASSLQALKHLQDRGLVAIRSSDLTRTHKDRLVKNGFLQQVMKGWYIPSRPDEPTGESTAWYASFWDFTKSYLNHRFGDLWCLSPEQSLLIHAGNNQVPGQLLVRAPKAGNKVTPLPHGTSFFDMKTKMPEPSQLQVRDGLRVFSIPAALVACSPSCFAMHPIELRTCLAMIQSASDVLTLLLDGGNSKVAGRLAGAFRNIGRDRIADDILSTMRSAEYDVREQDPFKEKLPPIGMRHDRSPHALRIELLWQKMREDIIGKFPAPTPVNDVDAYLKQVDDIYVTDAYHSLSIEGYRVSAELIERVRSGNWNPDTNEQDKEHKNALAARGYWQAFQEVRKGVVKVLAGESAGAVANEDHGAWYRELFAPSVASGILKASDLAGYRNSPVYIRRSKHVPLPVEAVRDAMPTLFRLLEKEVDPAVRIVLGHFIFVYIHPYTDGNGRTGRFLMNVMMAAGGYPWTVIPVERRDEYMATLESASVEQDIVPFTEFLADCLKKAGSVRASK